MLIYITTENIHFVSDDEGHAIMAHTVWDKAVMLPT